MTWTRVDRGLVATVSITAVAYLLVLPVFVERLDPLTGDEPFYVMTAISLVHEIVHVQKPEAHPEDPTEYAREELRVWREVTLTQ